MRQPDRHPKALAIEPDPNLAFEHWDEYWRKVHGPKFAHDEPGNSSELVLRYDQLHRVASGPSTFFRPPYRAMTEADGRLVSDPEKRVPTFRRPRWDGLAYIVYGEEADIGRTLDQEKFARRIIADEQVAFRTVTRGIGREHILIPSPQHRDPVSLVKIHLRHPELTRAASPAPARTPAPAGSPAAGTAGWSPPRSAGCGPAPPAPKPPSRKRAYCAPPPSALIPSSSGRLSRSG